MKQSIVLLAHNIRSLWNVGSLFRTADGFGVEKIYLTGYTACPPRREISKTALGAEEWIPWDHIADPLEAIEQCKAAQYSVVALEQTEHAIDVTDFSPTQKLCLILGHEVTGVPPELLIQCDDTVHIPMHGKKESLNVAVATGIALHALSTSAPS